MSTVLEYTYDTEPPALDDREALEVYTREKAANPDALVVLDQYNCGLHWKVTVHKTATEKEEFLRGKIRKIFDKVAHGIKP